MMSWLDSLVGQAQAPQGDYPPLLPPTGLANGRYPPGPPTDLYGNPPGPPMWEYGRMLPFTLDHAVAPYLDYWNPQPQGLPPGYQPLPATGGPGYGGMTVDEGGGSPLYELIQRLHQLWGR